MRTLLALLLGLGFVSWLLKDKRSAKRFVMRDPG